MDSASVFICFVENIFANSNFGIVVIYSLGLTYIEIATPILIISLLLRLFCLSCFTPSVANFLKGENTERYLVPQKCRIREVWGYSSLGNF